MKPSCAGNAGSNNFARHATTEITPPTGTFDQAGYKNRAPGMAACKDLQRHRPRSWSGNTRRTLDRSSPAEY